MKKLFIYLLMLCTTVAVSCGRDSAPAEKSVKVGVIRIDSTSNSFEKAYLGTIASDKIHLLLSPQGGTVIELPAKVGQTVKKGTVLAVVDAPNLNSLHKASEASLRQARDGYARAKKLHDAGGLSEIKWMEVQTKLAQAESAYEISCKSIEDCKVKAPFAGTVSEVYANLGEDLTVASRIAVIIDEAKLEALIAIPENDYSKTKEGDVAKVVVPALGDVVFDAVITKLGVNSTSISHSYSARLSIKDYPSSLKAGMACRVYMQSDMANNVTVPAGAVKTDDNGRYVWVVGTGDVIEKRRVVTKGYAGKGVAVSYGLKSGDLVVLEGISKVSSGMKVDPEIIVKK